jgi:hypothetical protein
MGSPTAKAVIVLLLPGKAEDLRRKVIELTAALGSLFYDPA